MNYRLYNMVLVVLILIQGYFFYYFVFGEGKQGGLQFMGIVSLIFGLCLIYILILLRRHKQRNDQQTFNEHLKNGEHRRLK
ncbi:hypothetical protein [Mammaliicoccus stepanovicii]|uniref:Uncharacterized protein n=1 Tax=Mammaliicoccus stepanovicii TaxID=643214 RepID=A0A239YED8_9STAP|nr:hypothetical protein [Mammaliicoccus stepanovicii]PNZ75866.1 hypothetical protein CD111_06480 [Mammaliicoccus stepanovicii]GGI42785.1 hypothetical protein GCM10010896_20150 [Mammaliicoccus stepanovicii]SNV57509.1 Uncharacterised protein [Mammaliicoccus stepanovicii]